MILSDEPGFYAPGTYGIRLENLVLVQPAEVGGGERPFLRFETLTLAPRDRRLIVPGIWRRRIGGGWSGRVDRSGSREHSTLAMDGTVVPERAPIAGLTRPVGEAAAPRALSQLRIREKPRQDEELRGTRQSGDTLEWVRLSFGHFPRRRCPLPGSG